MMRRLYCRFQIALCFLSIAKLPAFREEPFEPKELAASFVFFPLVGALLGAITVALIALGAQRLPSFPLAAWLVALWSLLTRGLHLDGLADCADGIGGAYEPERRLLIMKDSRVGAFGVIAILMDLLLKTGLLQVLIERHAWGPILVIPNLSRLAMVLAAVKSTYARRQGGLGKPFLEHMQRRHWLGACTLALVLTLPVLGPPSIVYFASTLAVVVVIRYFSSRLLGGITGDVLGATNEISEIALLTLAVLCS